MLASNDCWQQRRSDLPHKRTRNSSCIGEYFGAALAADLLRHRGAADSAEVELPLHTVRIERRRWLLMAIAIKTKTGTIRKSCPDWALGRGTESSRRRSPRDDRPTRRGDRSTRLAGHRMRLV
jgi:hypothetical protein